MTVTLDFASLDSGATSCLPQGQNAKDYEVKAGKDIRIIPGNTMSMTMRVTAGDPIEVLGVTDLGVIETKAVHGFSTGQPIHICFYSGLSQQQVSPYIIVGEIIDDHHFKIVDNATPPNPIVLTSENLLNTVDAQQPKICGWVAKAANLKGFTGAIVIDLDSGRRDQLLGTGSIHKGEKQLSVKGAFDVRKGDSVTIGSFTSCVDIVRTVNMPDGCYTIIQLCKAAPADVKFTDGKLVSLSPVEPLIEGIGYGDAWGWVNVTLPGSKTWILADYKSHTVNSCPQYVGEFRFELRGFSLDYPEWFTNVPCASESTYTRIIDWGKVWI